jgi:hypothetical protein
MTRKPSLRSAVLLGLAAPLAAQAADWPQFGYDAAHSGFNRAESAITAANVAQLQSAYPNGVALPASVDTAPVYLAGVATAQGPRNLLFLPSKNGRLMAVDAANGSVVWSNTTSGTQPTTASPAIDTDRQHVYAYGLDGKAHKYRVGDGGEVTGGGWPQTISLKTNVEKGAGALTIAGSGSTRYLAVVTDGYIGDGGNYQGHLVSIDLGSGAQRVFNVMCSDQTVHFDDVTDCSARRGGIWGRGGATFDAATNRFYLATGNGPFDASGRSWGDSVLALAADGSGAGNGLPHDSYTPSTYQHLEDADIDLGSVSPAILPVPAGSTVAHLGLQAGKDGVLRLIDLDDMSGQGGAGHVGGELQALDVPQGGNGYPNDRMREQPAVWVDPADHSTWVFVGNGSGISGLQLGLDGAQRPMLTARWTKSGASNASSSPVVAGGVLFNAGACGSGSGVCVNARNAHTGDVLWSSPAIGPLHWQSPIVVDGAVYVTDNNSKLWKFALPLGDTIFDDGFDG